MPRLPAAFPRSITSILTMQKIVLPMDVAIPMYNLIEYSQNYKKTTDSLWSCYRYRSVDPITESIKFKTSINDK